MPAQASKKAKTTSRERTVKIDLLTDKNIGQLKMVCSAVFPVSYSDKFYSSLLETPEQSRLAFVADDLMVGVLCTRLEPNSASTDPNDTKEPGQKLYIYTLGVLAPYRRMGVGAKLISSLIDDVLPQLSKQTRKRITEIYVHVQEGNDDALRFYEKFGFKQDEKKVENYYKRIKPSSAILMRRSVSDRQDNPAIKKSNE